MAAVQSTPHGENILEVESRRDGRIRTLDQLLKACQVDLKVWEVERYTVNKWEVGAKDPDGEIVVTPLFQVKGDAAAQGDEGRDNPSFGRLIPPKRYQTYTKPPGRRKAVTHGADFCLTRNSAFAGLPTAYCTRFTTGVRWMWQFRWRMRSSRPYIICLGDMLDLPEWSDKFPERPNSNRRRNRQLWPRTGGCGALREARPGAAIWLLEGNHDKRLELALVNHLKAAYGLRPADELELPPSMSIPRSAGAAPAGHSLFGRLSGR